MTAPPGTGLTVVVPAYNEASRLPRTLTEILGVLAPSGRDFEILVVDDGSTDGTAAVVLEFGKVDHRVKLVGLDRNRGKGAAVRAGVEQSAGDLVLFADADGSTPFAELAKLEQALAGPFDVAIGTRASREAPQQIRALWYRKLIGNVFNALVGLVVVRGFTDTQCGFKMFRGPVARDIFPRLRLDGFSFDVELLAVARLLGYRVREVAIDWADCPGSKVNLFFDSMRMLADLFRIRWWAFTGAYRHLPPQGEARAIGSEASPSGSCGAGSPGAGYSATGSSAAGASPSGATVAGASPGGTTIAGASPGGTTVADTSPGGTSMSGAPGVPSTRE